MATKKDQNAFFILEDNLSVTTEFEGNLKNLNDDICHIDLKLQSIQKHITVLESSLNNIQAQINSIQVTNKIPFYNAFNRVMEILNLFQSNYQKYLDLKFKYRKEQGDLKYRVVHMLKIDLKKLNSDDELTTGKLIEALRNIGSLGINKTTQVKDEMTLVDKEIQKVNENPNYKI